MSSDSPSRPRRCRLRDKPERKPGSPLDRHRLGRRKVSHELRNPLSRPAAPACRPGPTVRARPARDCACRQARAHGPQRQPGLRAEPEASAKGSPTRSRCWAARGGSFSGFCAFLLAWALLNAVRACAESGFRSLSLHFPQSAAVDAGGPAGARHHDEPEPAGGEGSLAAALDYEVNVKAESAIARAARQGRPPDAAGRGAGRRGSGSARAARSSWLGRGIDEIVGRAEAAAVPA